MIHEDRDESNLGLSNPKGGTISTSKNMRNFAVSNALVMLVL